MHRYEPAQPVDTTPPPLDVAPFTDALDIERHIVADGFVAQWPGPEVWHLDERGWFTCGYRGGTGQGIRRWSADPSDLRRSRRQGLLDGGCAPNWVIVEPRPTWLYPAQPVDERDVEQFLHLRSALVEVGVNLIDALLVDPEHWWSLHELVSGTTEWTMPVER